MALSCFSDDGLTRFFGDSLLFDGGVDNADCCAYLDGVWRLSGLSHTICSDPARSADAVGCIFAFRVNGSSFGFRVRGELKQEIVSIKQVKSVIYQSALATYRRVFGRIRFVFVVDVPSNICNAVRSSGEMRLKQSGLFVGDVIDFILSFSISKRIFSFRRRRSSSVQSRCLRIRHGSESERKCLKMHGYSENRKKIQHAKRKLGMKFETNIEQTITKRERSKG